MHPGFSWGFFWLPARLSSRQASSPLSHVCLPREVLEFTKHVWTSQVGPGHDQNGGCFPCITRFTFTMKRSQLFRGNVCTYSHASLWCQAGQTWAESWPRVQCRSPLESFTTACLLASRTDPIMQTQNEEKIFPTLLRDFTGSRPHHILQPSQNQGGRLGSSLLWWRHNEVLFIQEVYSRVSLCFQSHNW